VLAALIVDEDEHAAITRIIEEILDGGEEVGVVLVSRGIGQV